MPDDLDDLIGQIQRGNTPDPPALPLRITSEKGDVVYSNGVVIQQLLKQAQDAMAKNALVWDDESKKFLPDPRLPKDAPAIFEGFKGFRLGVPQKSLCLHYRHITENFHVGSLTNKNLGGWFSKFVHDDGRIGATVPWDVNMRINYAIDIARTHNIGMNKTVLFAFEWWHGADVILEILREGFVRG